MSSFPSILPATDRWRWHLWPSGWGREQPRSPSNASWERSPCQAFQTQMQTGRFRLLRHTRSRSTNWPVWKDYILKARTNSTRSAASIGSSCSQTTRICQLACSRRAAVSSSRLTFRASFSLHHAAFVFGCEPCSGHRCQKHPRTSTTNRARGNTTSCRRRPSSSTLWFTR